MPKDSSDKKDNQGGNSGAWTLSRRDLIKSRGHGFDGSGWNKCAGNSNSHTSVRPER